MKKQYTPMMIDSKGDSVPRKYVKRYDRERDRIARRVLARWIKTRATLRTCYNDTLADIESLEMLAHGQDVRLGGVKGNLTFQSFDGLTQISRLARYELRFDERLQAARDLIYAMIDTKSAEIDDDFAVIIRNVFAPTSNGMLSRSRVLSLLRYNVRNAEWLRAMDMIRESISSHRGKTLLSVSHKSSRDADWDNVQLDVAKVADVPEHSAESSP